MLKKLLLMVSIAMLFIAIPVFAADIYYIDTGSEEDSTWVVKADQPFSIILHDTLTLKHQNPAADTMIDLGGTYCNFRIRVWNPVTDSGCFWITFGADKGIWHTDSIARELAWVRVGYESDSTNYLIAPLSARYIWVRMEVGGTADSTAIFDIECYR